MKPIGWPRWHFEKALRMINKLLVALDGSNHSLKAVDYASEIAASLKARMIILSVVKVQELPEGLREYADLEHIPGLNLEILQKIATDLVAKAERRAKAKGVDDTVCEVEEGPVARTIVARAKHHDADLIVVGSRGLGNIEATLRGGVSHRVELLAKCPVLTVK
jgi:nucleotide-binding universal stress UspA family protein